MNFVDMDAAESLLALEPANEPPAEGERYVLVHLTMHNPTQEPVSVHDVKLHYDTPKRLYPAVVSSKYNLVTPHPAVFIGDVGIMGDYSGYVAFRTDDVDGELLRFRADDRSDETWVAVR